MGSTSELHTPQVQYDTCYKVPLEVLWEPGQPLSVRRAEPKASDHLNANMTAIYNTYNDIVINKQTGQYC